MASGISTDKLFDVLKTTTENLPMDKFATVLTYQKHPWVNRVFKSDRMEEDGGTMLMREVQLTKSGTARFILPYEKTSIVSIDTLEQFTSPWALLDDYWVTNRDAMLRNRGKSKFINHIKAKRVGTFRNLAELLEEVCAGVPDKATDKRKPYGMQYWISKADAAYEGQGFVGKTIRFGNGTTSTIKGGIDADEAKNAMWRNYVATYLGMNADFVTKMRRLANQIQFEAPQLGDASGIDTAGPSDLVVYMGIDELTEYEDLVTGNNDNYGPDVAPFNGRLAFRQNPVIHMPVLDNDPDNAIYFIRHSHLYPVILAGEWMIEDGPMRSPEQHRTFVTHINASFAILCDNVRLAGAVMHNPIE